MAEPQAEGANDASDVAVYVVSYLEAMPPSIGEAVALLRQYRETSRKDDGHGRLEVLQQNGRPDHFAIVERWRDQQALDAHAIAAHTRQFRDRLQPLCSSPYDERLHRGFAMGAALAARGEGAVYVLTHADAVPAGKDEAMALLQQLAASSRNDGGGIGFAVLQQHSRQNHFTIVELWRDQQAVEAHAMAAHTRQFREKFQPLTGSLYDERLYRAVD
jgi:quinol monooxygenase YgiN